MFIQQSVRSVRLCHISCGEGSGHPVAMSSKCERGNDSSGSLPGLNNVSDCNILAAKCVGSSGRPVGVG